VVESLLRHVEPALRRSGDWALAESGVERLLTTGTGATRQRHTYARTGRLLDVVAQAVRVTAGHE
jgi:carboxylate-amine ligase